MSVPNGLNDALLQSYASGFYGYGSHTAPIWFVGLEEGGAQDLQEVAHKVEAWHLRGKRELEDLWEFHVAIGIDRWFGATPRIQTTWGKYTRLVLSAKGIPPTRDEVRRYQSTQLGRAHSETCLIELLPLPSPSTGVWPYVGNSTLVHLGSRSAYRAHYLQVRAAHISRRIRECQPLVVIFAGINMTDTSIWTHFGLPSPTRHSIQARAFAVTRLGSTLIVAMQHPAARGVPNSYFEGLGEWISQKVPVLAA